MKLFIGPGNLSAHLLTYARSIKSTTLYQVTNQVVRRGMLYTLVTGFRFRRIIWNAHKHRYLTQLLKTNPQVAALSQANPRLIYKYLGQYLAMDLPTKDKLGMLTSHYHYFTKCVRPHFFEDILHKTYIWQDRQGDDSFGIGLFFPVGLDWEGELAVVMECNETPVYTIRFTIVAGQLKDSLFGESIFVGGIQGVRNPDLVKQATKTLFDIAPAALLMAALQGMALACNLKYIWGQATKGNSLVERPPLIMTPFGMPWGERNSRISYTAYRFLFRKSQLLRSKRTTAAAPYANGSISTNSRSRFGPTSSHNSASSTTTTSPTLICPLRTTFAVIPPCPRMAL